MSAVDIRIQRLAKEDLRDARLWYETQSSGLGATFVEEAVRAIRKAASTPLLYPIVDTELSVRRVLVRRFPYKVYYTVETNRIIIHAVINARRAEQIWADRTR